MKTLKKIIETEIKKNKAENQNINSKIDSIKTEMSTMKQSIEVKLNSIIEATKK